MPWHETYNQFHEEFRKFKNKVAVAVIIIALGCAVGIYVAYNAGKNANEAIHNFAAESATRRDETCTISERQDNDEIRQLKRTFVYIRALSSDELGQTINQFILQQLPETVAKATKPNAPEFCNEPGIGLKEPGPPIPEIPKDINNLIDTQ